MVVARQNVAKEKSPGHYEPTAVTHSSDSAGGYHLLTKEEQAPLGPIAENIKDAAKAHDSDGK